MTLPDWPGINPDDPRVTRVPGGYDVGYAHVRYTGRCPTPWRITGAAALEHLGAEFATPAEAVNRLLAHHTRSERQPPSVP